MTTGGRFLRHEGPTVRAEDFGFLDDPGPTLERVFGDIHQHRMLDVPLCNHALRVEAVGFRRTEDGWLGVLVTPWSMNVLLLPARGAHWTHMLLGAKRWQSLASGSYELFGSREEGVGEFHYFSLFSPMAGFASQDEARSTAAVALGLLVDPHTAEKIDALATKESRDAANDRSRRHFLLGRFSSKRR